MYITCWKRLESVKVSTCIYIIRICALAWFLDSRSKCVILNIKKGVNQIGLIITKVQKSYSFERKHLAVCSIMKQQTQHY